jgi:hypothetical protein
MDFLEEKAVPGGWQRPISDNFAFFMGRTEWVGKDRRAQAGICRQALLPKSAQS